MTITEVPSATQGALSDEELTALALAADAAEPIPDDAVPWSPHADLEPLVADWYLPAGVSGRRDWRSRLVAGAFIASLVLINATGLCVTYGRVVLG